VCPTFQTTLDKDCRPPLSTNAAITYREALMKQAQALNSGIEFQVWIELDA